MVPECKGNNIKGKCERQLLKGIWNYFPSVKANMNFATNAWVSSIIQSSVSDDNSFKKVNMGDLDFMLTLSFNHSNSPDWSTTFPT